MPIIASRASAAYGAGFGKAPSGSAYEIQGSYDALASVTTTGSTTQIVTLSGIPTNYRHLQIRATMNCTDVNNMYMRFGNNGVADEGANYAWHQLYGDGGSTLASNGTGSATFMYVGYNFNVSYPNTSIIEISDYANIFKNKTMKSLSVNESNGSGFVQIWGGHWRNTNPTDTISFTAGAGYFNAGSIFSVYGVK